MRWSIVAGLAIALASVSVAVPVQAQQAETESIEVDFSGLLGAIRSKIIGVAQEPEPEVPSEPEIVVEAVPDEEIVTAESEKALPPNLVEEVQILLADLGYEPGNPDGIVGPSTIQALEQFQRNQGVPVDGELSVELLGQLQTIRATADVLDQQGGEAIVVASGATSEDEGNKTPILDPEPAVEAQIAEVGRFEIIGVSLGDSLGSVRRLRPFDQKGELDESLPLVTAKFGGSEGEILRKLEVRFGPDNEAVWVQLEQGNFPIDAIPGIVGNLCERYGDTAGCLGESANLVCESPACRKGLHVHEMSWHGEGGKVLEAAFFTGGSQSVTQVVLTLRDNEAVLQIEQISRDLQARPDAAAFKL